MTPAALQGPLSAGADLAPTAPASAEPHVGRARGAGRWLTAALGLTLLFSWRTMAPAFGPEHVVQGDARQHLFWTARFRDAELFRDDLIAEYYRAVAPPAFAAFYWAVSHFAEPLQASKPIPILLGLAAAFAVFGLVSRLCDSPRAAFLAAALLSWYVWQYDDLPSATPRAFLLPLLAGLVWALAAGQPALGVLLVGLLAVFYPVGAALGLALLGTRLIRVQRWRPALATRRGDWLTFGAALVLAGALLLPGQLSAGRFGPTASGAEARALPDFGPSGRIPVFVGDGYRYWIASGSSGLDLRATDVLAPELPLLFVLLAPAALLPLALVLHRRRFGARRFGDGIGLLPRLLIASFGLFFAAHALLLHLYLPSRYVKWSVPLVLAVAGGLALGLLAEVVGARLAAKRWREAAGGLTLALGVGLALYPVEGAGHFQRDAHPEITAYLRAQPKDVLVAGVADETDQVPAFAARRVLTSREFALPFHLGYYAEIRRRTEDLIAAYYAESPREVAAFAERYGVDVFLVNRAAFDPATFRRAWNYARSEETFAPLIARRLERTRRFALLELADRCAALVEGAVAVVPTTCLQTPG